MMTQLPSPPPLTLAGGGHGVACEAVLRGGSTGSDLLLLPWPSAGVKVTEDAAAGARRIEQDQKPKVELVVVDSILEALSLALPPA